ncbi:MAG: neutral/alkaline non-lysosomal ceramidase N-terminal domain-containing protein [Polyangiales bacterium]
MTEPRHKWGLANGWAFAILVALFAASCSNTDAGGPDYLIGAGTGDITGPVVDVAFEGYVRPTHIASGVHTRLKARAFIMGELEGSRRLVYVVAELLNMSHEIRLSVVDNLRATHGDLYSLDNVVISATHTHSSPGGYAHEGSFRQAYFDAVVAGITEAIESAHDNLQPGRIFVGTAAVADAGVNRSAIAYRQNPEAERGRYEHDTDQNMTLLRLEGADGPIGALNWFAVHPTSLTYNNTLVSADHKGFAALQMEQKLRSREDTPEGFVAAFAQSNCGDVTGNLNLDNTGPGVDDYDSARIIGQRQLDAAMQIFESAGERLAGGVDYRLSAVDFTDLEVDEELTGAGPQRTCFPAYGYSFAGGSTEDGGGHPLFMEGMVERDEGIDALVQVVIDPPPVTDELRACHAPKPILYRKEQQDPLPIGVAKIGQLAMVFIPSEATTMSGRRMRDTVREVLREEVEHVVIAGYANDYSGYITTPEEYAVQQYEGGHTLFGPWTLPAFRQELAQLTRALAQGQPGPGAADQGDLRGRVESTPLGNDYDEPPADGSFGDVTTDPNATYLPGDTVSVAFWTGHPDNAFRRGASYVEIQRLADAAWSTVMTEGDWPTQVRWTQASRVIPPYDPLDPFATPPPPINEAFTVSITWQIPEGIEPGTYRVVFHGSEKDQVDSQARIFTAETSSFEVTGPAEPSL